MILVFGPTIKLVNELNDIGGSWRPDKNAWMFEDSKRSRLKKLIGSDEKFYMIDYVEPKKNPKMEKIDRGGSADVFSDGKSVNVRVRNEDTSRDLIIRVRKKLGKSGFVLPQLKKLSDGTYRAPLYHVQHPIVDMIFEHKQKLEKNEFLGRLEYVGIDSRPYKMALDMLENEASGSIFRLDIAKRNIVVDDNRNVVMLDPIVSMPKRNPRTLKQILDGATRLARKDEWDELEKYADENVEQFLALFEKEILKITGKSVRLNNLKDHSNAISCMVTGDTMTRSGVRVRRDV